MIKMFGWERKMAKHIDEKREIEMSCIFWNKVYALAAMQCKCVIFPFFQIIMAIDGVF